jgi:tetratricopeptide (TPR) repeat protein
MAHYLLGTAQINANEDGRPELIKAYELRDRASELEKLSITANHHRVVTRDWNEALETYGMLRQIYPRDSVGRYLSGNILRNLGRLDEALATTTEALKLNPTSSLIREGFVDTFLHLNRFDDAWKALFGEDGKPLDAPLYPSLRYQIAFLRSDSASMQRELEWFRTHPDNRQMLQTLARFALFHGKLGEFAELRAQVPARGSRRGTTAITADPFAGLTLLTRLAMELPRNAAQDGGLDGNPPLAVNLVSFELNGNIPVAQRRLALETLAKEFPQSTELNLITLPTAKAALELAEGRPASAINQLQTVRPYERSYTGLASIYLRALAYLKAESGKEAAAEFQKLIDYRGIDVLSPLHAVAYVGLGRAHAMAKETDKAREAYEKFFDLWKDADRTIPILVHAREEYAQLK